MAEKREREAALSSWEAKQVAQQKADHKKYEEENAHDKGATSAELEAEWAELKKMEKEIEEETLRVLEDSQTKP